MKETTRLRKQVAHLREGNKYLREKILKLENDQRKFRDTFRNNLFCAIEMLGKNQTWNMQYVVKTLSEQMTKFERWHW